MIEFKEIDVDETPYLYEERTTSMDPSEIGAAMGSAFQNVFGFMNTSGVQTTGKVMSVYHTHDPEKLTFRSGFSVAEADLAKAKDAVKADKTPAGKVLTFTHIGPYSTLRESYAKMMEHAAGNGLKVGAPTWEVYVNDPRETPEDELRTDVFAPIV